MLAIAKTKAKQLQLKPNKSSQNGTKIFNMSLTSDC